MKVLGFEITRKQKKRQVVKDLIPEVKTSIPDTKRPALMQRVRDPSLNYHATRKHGRGSFTPGEYNLADVGRIEDTDSFVRQAFDKKVALMLKEGWDIVGGNPRTVKYVKTRFAQIARATQVPTEQLLRDIGSALIRKSNAFVVKVRNIEKSGGKVRSDPSGPSSIKPVAGYFLIPAETMEFRMTGTRITRWRQKMPNGSPGDYKEWNPRDIIHFYFDRKEGFVFGTPQIVPVTDDIRALRKIEENIELLIYQHLFPLFQYIVGTPEAPAGYTEDGRKEIDVVRQEIQFMPTEGGIVTPERHEIKAIGAEGRALRAEGFLEHFKQRVFAGLGVSSVDMGEGHTANRACYSEDTETLTDSGFKYYWQITKQDKIATFNPETNRIEFQYPNGDILLYHYQGKMVEFKNRNVDVLVTPDHDMWMGRPRNNQELTWEKIHADSIDIHQYKFRSGGLLWDGIEPEDFRLPYVPYNCYSKVPNSGPFPRIDIYDWLEFLGYYVSEGCLAKGKEKWAITLSQNSIENKTKTEKIRACLNRLPFHFNEYTDPSDNTTRFWINCKSLYLYLEENCGDYSYLKRLPEGILDYNTEALRVVFEAAMLGDGTKDKRPGRATYYSTSDKLLDQIQEIALKLGYRAHILSGSECNRVCISWASKSNVVRDHMWSVDYNGMVYCFNVPNHLFITRRNGKVGIHGNTADNMSRNLIDSVKDFQRIIEMFFNEFVISELLLESTFGPSALDEDNKVYLRFREIDIDAQIKKEAHYADQFSKHVINHDEARVAAGKEPWLIPSPDEAREGTASPEKYPEWHKSFWKLIREPELLIQSIDEPYSMAAKAAASNSSLETTEQERVETGKEKTQEQIALEKEKAKSKRAPAAQVARKRAAQQRDAFLRATFLEVKTDIIDRIKEEGKVDHDWVSGLIRTQMNTTINRLVAQQVSAFRSGYSELNSTNNEVFITRMPVVRTQLRDRAENYILKLTENIISSLKRNIAADLSITEMSTRARSVFDAAEFRTSFIEDVEIRKARSYGQAISSRDRGSSTLKAEPNAEEPCDTCKTNSLSDISLQYITLDDVPPYHANCGCSLAIKSTETILEDSADNPEGAVPESIFAKCPECGKTATTTNTPSAASNNGVFTCKACGHSFQKTIDIKEADTEDRHKSAWPGSLVTKLLGPQGKHAKFQKCKRRAKSRLRARHPSWSEQRIITVAEAACEYLLDMVGSDEELEDVLQSIEEIEGNIEDATLEECVLGVKKSLREDHPDWSEDKVKSRAFAICKARRNK